MDDNSRPNEQKGELTGEDDRISELLDVLAKRRRRYAIHCLHTFETPMAVADITDEIVRIEIPTEPTAVPEVRKQGPCLDANIQ